MFLLPAGHYVLIKHKLYLSDEETVLQLQENQYLQNFVGFSYDRDDQLIAPSLFVEIHNRMRKDVFVPFENAILEEIGMVKAGFKVSTAIF